MTNKTTCDVDTPRVSPFSHFTGIISAGDWKLMMPLNQMARILTFASDFSALLFSAVVVVPFAPSVLNVTASSSSSPREWTTTTTKWCRVPGVELTCRQTDRQSASSFQLNFSWLINYNLYPLFEWDYRMELKPSSPISVAPSFNLSPFPVHLAFCCCPTAIKITHQEIIADPLNGPFKSSSLLLFQTVPPRLMNEVKEWRRARQTDRQTDIEE